MQRALDDAGTVEIADTWEGEADVAAYSVVHGRDGGPEWALLVCDVADGPPRTRSTEPELLAGAESRSSSAGACVGSTAAELPTGPGHRNLATLAPHLIDSR